MDKEYTKLVLWNVLKLYLFTKKCRRKTKRMEGDELREESIVSFLELYLQDA